MSDSIPAALNGITYLTGAAKPEQLPWGTGREILCIGRSNSGKSSIINAALNTKTARTSRTPGRTQLVHFFQLPQGDCLLDCPGYGFAAVNQRIKAQWPPLLRACLKRPTLVGILWIMDIRHPLQPADLKIQADLIPSLCPIHIVLNKADQLRFGAGKQALIQFEAHVKTLQNPHRITVQACSAKKRTGLDELRAQLCEWFNR